MKKLLLVLSIWITLTCVADAQHIKKFFYADQKSKELPVLLRGNLDNNTILIFVQGGPGETAIDFARSDYPRWKKTLEKEVAIAYYDQRGLNKRVNKIDSTKINYKQYGEDIIAIAKLLKKKYKSRIFLLGHSAGGGFINECLADHPDKHDLIEGAIVSNTPMTSDYSPERFNYYRPLYLKNLAKEFVSMGVEVEKWEGIYNWMEKEDSIHTREVSRKWNQYVEEAFSVTKRKITSGMAIKVLFARPYNPIKVFNFKDNDRVNDLLHYIEEIERPFSELKIDYPMLIITGRYDDIAPPEEMEVMHKLVSGSRLVILPNAGHQSFLDNAEGFNKAVLEFVLIKKR